MFGNKILNAYSPGGHRQGLIYVGTPGDTHSYVQTCDRFIIFQTTGEIGVNVDLCLDNIDGHYIHIYNPTYLPVEGITYSGDWYPIAFIDGSLKYNINGRILSVEDFDTITDTDIKSSIEYVRFYGEDNTYIDRKMYVVYMNVAGYPIVPSPQGTGQTIDLSSIIATFDYKIRVDNTNLKMYADANTPVTVSNNTVLYVDDLDSNEHLKILPITGTGYNGVYMLNTTTECLEEMYWEIPLYSYNPFNVGNNYKRGRFKTETNLICRNYYRNPSHYDNRYSRSERFALFVLCEFNFNWRDQPVGVMADKMIQNVFHYPPTEGNIFKTITFNNGSIDGHTGNYIFAMQGHVSPHTWFTDTFDLFIWDNRDTLTPITTTMPPSDLYYDVT